MDGAFKSPGNVMGTEIAQMGSMRKDAILVINLNTSDKYAVHFNNCYPSITVTVMNLVHTYHIY